MVSSGEILGEGILSPLGRRGFDRRNGDPGPCTRPGDAWRRGELDKFGKIKLLRFLLLSLLDCEMLFSDEGDSVTLAAAMREEEGTLLLSLLSPTSLSASSDPRLTGWDVPKTLLMLFRERGVGHSKGLAERVETATEDPRWGD